MRCVVPDGRSFPEVTQRLPVLWGEGSGNGKLSYESTPNVRRTMQRASDNTHVIDFWIWLCFVGRDVRWSDCVEIVWERCEGADSEGQEREERVEWRGHCDGEQLVLKQFRAKLVMYA